MFPGTTPRQINEEFTAEQVRELMAAYPGYRKKMSQGEDAGDELSDDAMANMF